MRVHHAWVPTVLCVGVCTVLCVGGACRPEGAAPVAVDAGPADAGTAFATTEDEDFADALTGHRHETHTDDWPAIQKRGVLRVITRNNSTGYFLYRGRETGFFMEVARMLGRDLGVRVEMVVPGSQRDLVPFLLDGKGDVIVHLSLDADRADRVAFTTPTLSTPWAVVMRQDAAATSLEALANVPLQLHASSGALRRVRALSMDGGIALRAEAALETLEPEDLMDLVSEGTAAACVVPRRVADVERVDAPELTVAMDLPGEPDVSAMAVRRENPELLEKLNAFLRKRHRGTDWNVLYKRFHEPGERTRTLRDEEWRADRKGALTPWDAQLQQAAREEGLDWRLLAAQAYQESRFDASVRSEAGAVGLMQLMPATARELGVTNPADPLQSLQAGARYMGRLLRGYPPDLHLKDRVRFALAAYNAGPSHLADARVLARKLGLSPSRWFGNVEKAMRLLSKPRHYRQARFGYCRGEEPVRYVSQIQTRYDGYVAMTENRVEDAR